MAQAGPTFRVLQIDHVELFVPDRREAAAWYEATLGLRIVPEFEVWAENPRGPLMISSDDASTKLALFQGEPQGDRPTAGYHRVAFRVDRDGFLEFLRRLEDHPLRNFSGQRVTRDGVVDHEQAFSIYFADPYGHRLEVTTYDYEATREALQQAS